MSLLGIFVDSFGIVSVLSLVPFVSGLAVLHQDRATIHISKIIAIILFIVSPLIHIIISKPEPVNFSTVEYVCDFKTKF